MDAELAGGGGSTREITEVIRALAQATANYRRVREQVLEGDRRAFEVRVEICEGLRARIESSSGGH